MSTFLWQSSPSLAQGEPTPRPTATRIPSPTWTATPLPSPTGTPPPTPTIAPYRIFLPLVLKDNSPTATVTPTPTTTPTATPVVPDLRVVYIVYDLPPDDLSTEYVRLQSYAPAFVDMTGWNLADQDGNFFTFPSFALNAGAFVRVWTKAGANSATDLYWGLSAPVWNNDHDCARLRDTASHLVSEYCY
jgi:hypothetical protein